MSKRSRSGSDSDNLPEAKRVEIAPKRALEQDTDSRANFSGQVLNTKAGLNSQELSRLGLSYWNRFKQFGNLGDLEKGIELESRALALTPDGHPDVPEQLANLGVSYTDRFRHLGNLYDLDKSIEHCSRAVALTPDSHPHMPERLANLGVSYGDRFQRLGELDDLAKSIELDTRALAVTPNSHPSLPIRLANLGVSYTDRFRRLGELDDLDKSIEHCSRAVALTPDSHPDMPKRLTNLGVAYTDRFERLGKLDDLEQVIELESRALALTPDGHPDRPERLANLGVSYGDRFQRLGELDDLEKSIKHKSRAVALTPDGHPDMQERLANLGVSYSDRFQRLGELDDLDKSIQHKSCAVILTPEDHPDMPERLANLGVSYADRFRQLSELGDLEKSIEHCSHALTLTPDGHPDMQERLANLGVSYTDRFRRLGEPDILEKAIKLGTRALELTPDDHPDISQRHFNQAQALLLQYQLTAKPSHLTNILHTFRTASQLLTGGPRRAFQNALGWAKLAFKYDFLSRIEAYQTTINLLPQFIWLGATTRQRYHDLSTAENLAVSAACAAILAADYPLALEWLEHARSVVWNQSVMLRSPLNQLHSSNPELATRLQAVSNRLHSASSETHGHKVVSSDSMTSEQMGQQRRRLAREYQDLLAQARQLPEFEDFLWPIKANNLTSAARNGPVAVINCHTDRCDALLILPGHTDITHIPLTEFTKEKARTSRIQLEKSLRLRQLRERGVKPLWQPQYKDHTESVLAALWTHIVKPVLDALGYTNNLLSDNLPHITWCPTGALSFLPLHAAGDYSQPQERVFNYVISSYTPTVTALITSTLTTLNDDCCVLAIGQAVTPGHTPLPGTLKELACVESHMQGKAEYSQLMDYQATTRATLDAMEHHDWIHLACHAHQNVADPTKSGFFLHDGTLDLASINWRSFKSKGLAFLSACQTATGDERLPDEAIHLALGMLMAGYQSVIATMWSVHDDNAPIVAEKVYAQLMRDGKIGNGEAGEALHYAVAELHEKVGEKKFGRWAPYIHIGS